VGFRFRKSLRIASGIRLNLSGSGLSTTLGGRGASLNVGSRGSRATVGVLGSGISYSTKLSGGRRPNAPKGAQADANGCGLLAVIGGLVLLIGMCSSGSNQAPVPPSRSPSGSGELTYVDSRSVNCRAEPSKEAPVRLSFQRGDSAPVLERSGEWTKVSNFGTECWISSSLLSAAPTVAAAAASGAAAQSLLSDSSGQRSSYSSSSGRRSSYSSNSGSSARKSARKSGRSSKAKRSRSSGGYSGSSCPCSGSKICIGPRGGRYCITSGGNKRYGV
jgi:hypothetical protein